MRYFSILAAMMIASGAAAQNAPSAQPAYVEVKQGDIVISELNLTVDQVEDMVIYDTSGARVGEVEDVLGSSPGAPVALAVDVDRYLGADGDDVVLTFAQVEVRDNQLVTSLVKEDIARLPRFVD